MTFAGPDKCQRARQDLRGLLQPAVPAGDTLVSIVEHILGELTLKTKRRRGDREGFLAALGMILQVRALPSGGCSPQTGFSW